MPVEIEVHTVPHFKAPVNAKVELWRLACGGTFTVQTSLSKIGSLVHKLGFIGTEVVGTVGLFWHFWLWLVIITMPLEIELYVVPHLKDLINDLDISSTVGRSVAVLLNNPKTHLKCTHFTSYRGVSCIRTQGLILMNFLEN